MSVILVKCVFDEASGQGKIDGYNRDPGPGEKVELLDPTTIGLFSVDGRRYQYIDGVFSEVSSWNTIHQTSKFNALQKRQLSLIDIEFENIIQSDISFTTAAGVTKTYQADPVSRQNLHDMLTRYQVAGNTPSDFYWVSSDNTPVPFTLADLQGLWATGIDAGWIAFKHRQDQKNAIRAITDSSDTGIVEMQNIVW